MRPEFVIFLDENHHNNKAILHVLTSSGVRYERHGDHFSPGTADADWLPSIGERGWVLLTADKRIRYRHLERASVMKHAVGMFCFTSNNMGATTMARSLERAIAAMQRVVEQNPPPFIATISESGQVNVRETFADK